MVTNFADDFAVTWQDPADAQQTWIYDPMHTPDPLCASVAEFSGGMLAKYMGARTVFVNGYQFGTAPTPLPPSPEILERGVFDVWTKDFQPKAQSICESIRATNYDGMSLTELGDAIPDIMARAITAFGYTMRPITGFMGPTFGFVAFLQNELGADGPRLAATMLQGFENGTAAAGAGLSRLAEEAAQHPAVVEALRQERFDDLESVEGGAAFVAKLRGYLEVYGWRTDSWGVMERPTWAEDPRLPLSLISQYIKDSEHSPAAAHRRSGEQRDVAVREVEGRLSAEKLPAFREMLETTRIHVPVSEGRALWQLITMGSLRVPLLALGRKLVDAGALKSADQVFYFNTAELKEAAHRPVPELATMADKRRAELARWRALKPPPFIGAPPDPSQMPEEVLPLLTLFLGVGEPSIEGREIKGQAASKGVVRARARVLRDLGEAQRLQPGEVLVCATTAPPWTPLFAIAAAVVTDAGGVLSHSGICAREYAIPCVVATHVATQMIADGSMITVDGTNGVVTIEG